MSDFEFLNLEDVLEIHRRQIRRFGGGDGVRDRDLLESAIAQPRAAFGGVYLHQGLFEMAAAYFFHLVLNHPFVDGNKRVGLASALVFLDINDAPVRDQSDAIYEITMALARGEMGKSAIARCLCDLAVSVD